MPAAKYDIALEQGASFSRTITWKDSDGNPVDLTGSTARMQVRTAIANRSTTAPLVDLTNGSGITLGGTAGTIVVNITAAQTAALKITRAPYDLFVYSVDGTAIKLLEGVVTVDPMVTVNA